MDICQRIPGTTLKSSQWPKLEYLRKKNTVTLVYNSQYKIKTQIHSDINKLLNKLINTGEERNI